MVTVPEARERTDLPPQTEAMAAGTEKKRKHSSRYDKTTRISHIKCALEEVIINTDPKELETYEILEHLTAAHKAMEMTCSLLPGNEQMEHNVTMVGRSVLFHQWQARRGYP